VDFRRVNELQVWHDPKKRKVRKVKNGEWG